MTNLDKFGFVQCPECERVFDLDNKAEANEWYYGHDCFLEEDMNADNRS